MKLTESGESRVNGYLFVLERSLKTFLPRDAVNDAVKEIDSHLRDRIEMASAAPDERAALEKILAELGPPLRVAQAYSAERTVEEAVTTGHVVPILRAVWTLAATTTAGFFAGLGLFIGYAVSLGFFAIAVLKPIFPDNVGLQYINGMPVSFGAHFPLKPGTELHGGYGIIPFAIFMGLGVFVATQRGARRYLSWWRSRRPGLS